MKTLGQFRAAMLTGLLLSTTPAMAQKSTPTTHTIFMTAVELKGATTSENLVPPSVNPKDLSKGYDYKPPAKADKNDPKKWEVSSYRFDPGFVTVIQDDTVKLTVFIVNGDEHDVRISDPDGRDVVAVAKWSRGREITSHLLQKRLARTS